MKSGDSFIYRAVRLYCVLYLFLYLLGGLVPHNFQGAVIGITIHLGVFFLLRHLLIVLAPPYALVLIVLAFTRLKSRRILLNTLLLFTASVLQFSASMMAVIAPSISAAIACVLLLLLLPFRRRLWRYATESNAFVVANFLFAVLTVVGLPGANLTMSAQLPRHVPADPDVHLVKSVRNPYDVAILGEGAGISYFSGSGFMGQLIDPEKKAVDPRITFPDLMRPQRSVLDETRGRLFVIGHKVRHEKDAKFPVVKIPEFTVERWLEMPGCRAAINIDLNLATNELVALCEPQPLAFVYDLDTLETNRIEKIPGGTVTGYDLEFLGDDLVVSSSGWPFLHRYAPNAEVDDSGSRWTENLILSMALVLAADPEAGLLYAALPLERKIGVFDAQSLERVSEIPTAGRVRDMELDPDAGWLFTGSYFNGMVEQFDTRTGDRLNAWQVGSLLRGVAWDAANGQLYTASAAGVHRIDLGIQVE